MPENLVSRDGFGSSVPRQPAHLHTQAGSGAYLRGSSRVPHKVPVVFRVGNQYAECEKQPEFERVSTAGQLLVVPKLLHTHIIYLTTNTTTTVIV